MRGLFSLVTLCAILTLSSCATYSFVDSGTNCEVAGKSSILTQTECEAAYATLASDAKDAGFAEASRGCMFRAASYNLYYSTTATGNFACSSQYRCVCSEPSAQPTDATTIDYDTTCYHLKSVYQDSACCSSITTDSTEYDQADADADMAHDDLTSKAAGYGVIAGKLKDDEECPLVLTFNPTSGTPQGVSASYVAAHSQRISTLSSASFIN